MSYRAPGILSARFGRSDGHRLDVYEAEGGYRALREVLDGMSAAQVVETVEASGLRGRGRDDSPTGVRWGLVPGDADPVFFIVQAGEPLPGVFKDRYLLDYDPHQIIEGAVICAYAVRAHLAFIAVRGEWGWLVDRLERALDEARAAGYLGCDILGSGFDLEMIVHRGAGAHSLREMTSLIDEIAGLKGQPRIEPPLPVVSGLLGAPTVVENAETVAVVPWIISNGAAAYRAIGTQHSAGTKLWSVAGPVRHQGVFEVPLGTPFADFFDEQLGGMRDHEVFKACLVCGEAVFALTPAEIMNCALDYESLQKTGASLGCGGMIIVPERTDMTELAKSLMRFYRQESCGRCAPCREGTGWLFRIASRLVKGEAVPADLDLLESVCSGMQGLTICSLAGAAATTLRSSLQRFGSEFAARIHEESGAGSPSRWPRGE